MRFAAIFAQNSRQQPTGSASDLHQFKTTASFRRRN
jgi:hypothetical protein